MTFSRLAASGGLLILFLGCGGAPSDADRTALEEEFAAMMTNAVLEGHFTSGWDATEPTLRAERYEVQGVSKLAGDLWTIQTRIQYGERDVVAPVPARVVWAGDTPMISLTDVTIPGVGTFTARVTFYRDRYAGMWWAGDERGGSLFGIVRRQ